MIHRLHVRYGEIKSEEKDMSHFLLVIREGSYAEIFLAQKNVLPPLSCIGEIIVSNIVYATLRHQSHKANTRYGNLGGTTDHTFVPL